MILQGKIAAQVPAQKAWDFLLDIDRFASCVPGLENVSQIDARTFDGVVVATVGPISGKFTFRSTIIDSAPPLRMVVQTDGADSVTHSAVSATLTVTLGEAVENRTEIGYRADIAIKGRLAILGDMVLRATGALVLEEFGRRLRTQLEADAGTTSHG